jgi:hypothetical protein
MIPAETRRLYRAARAVDTIPSRAAALTDRYDRARTTLAVALAAGPVALPGYRISDGPDGPTVARVDVPADQLALWHELAREENHAEA